MHNLPCIPRYFKETRVAVVIDDFTVINYQACSDEVFLTTAEMQGNVFTLQGFERFIYRGEFKALQDEVQHPNYLIVRFIDMYEYNGTVYCNDVEVEREELC